MFQVCLAKETFKFSCSHFTILSPTAAERLHGHNYQVRVELIVDELDPQLGFAFDFNTIKPIIRKICDSIDERILLPAKSPFLKLRHEGAQLHVEFGHKTYAFPHDDTFLLPLVNITSEELARHFGDELAKHLSSISGWKHLAVNIEETRGQSVTYTRAR